MIDSSYKSPLVSCVECKVVTSSKGLFTHFISNHTETKIKKNTGKGTGKFLLMCCDIKTKKEISTANLSKNIKLENNKKDIIKICPKCEITHIKDGKFCSRKCANSHIVSQEHKIKTSNSLRKKPIKEKSPKPDLFITTACRSCQQSFITRRCSPRKSCSVECAKILRRIGSRKGGQSSASKMAKRSKQEIELFDMCSSYYSVVTHNERIANGWDADILIYDHKIAILWNGPWHYREMNIGNHSLKQVQNRDALKIKEFEKIGWKVKIFEDRYYTPESAFIVLHKQFPKP